MTRQLCFFIGHRDAPWSIYPQLLQTVACHVKQFGVSDFYVGQYGNFDAMAARAVAEVKQSVPGICLYLLLPYHPAERPVSLPSGFDGSYYPPDQHTVPRRAAIVRANRHMVRCCQFLICYAGYAGGGTYSIVEFAQRLQANNLLQVTNLFPESKLSV